MADFFFSPSFFSPSTRMQAEGQARSQDLQAMQRDFPASSWVSLEVYGQKFLSRGFKPSIYRIEREIKVRGEKVGTIGVSVGPVFDKYHKSATLPEEERLVEMVAALLGKLVEKIVGKPALVPADDKRPAITPTASAQEDFQ